LGEGRRTVVSVDGCNEKRYSVVNVECLDRPRLMFDTVCTLADLHYVVFHASISSHGPFASQVCMS
jgi:UTP:GlnB (protein PII) uridylyltransferase